MLEIENLEQKRKLNNSVMTYSKMSSVGHGLFGTTTAGDMSMIDHQSDNPPNLRIDSNPNELNLKEGMKSEQLEFNHHSEVKKQGVKNRMFNTIVDGSPINQQSRCVVIQQSDF